MGADSEKIIRKYTNIGDCGNIYIKSDFVDIFKSAVEDKYSYNYSGVYSGASVNAANHWNVSRAMVSQVINGKSKPTKPMLDDMGYEEHTITFYVKKRYDKKAKSK